jgi:hypothetical protein
MEGGKREWWGLRCRLRLHAPCVCLRRGGDGRARAAHGPLALHNRHDSVAICPAEMEPDGGLTANF